MPTSGNVATLGVPCVNAIQLAVDQYNSTRSADEPPLRLIAEDSAAQPKGAVAAFTKLVTVNRVAAVIGPLTSGEALATAPLANRYRVPFVSPGASTPELTDAGPYVFRNELSDRLGGAEQARLARELGFSKIAVLYMNNDYGVGLYTVFRQTFEQLGGRVVAAEAFTPDAVDFRTHIAKSAAAKPDALLAIGVDELVNIVRQTREAGIQIPIYTTPIFENQTYIEQLRSTANGVIYVYYGEFDPAASDARSKKFVVDYHARFGVAPTYYSALGYDAAGLIIAALKRTRFDGSQLVQALHAINGYPGITGKSSFDKNGDIAKPVTLKTVRDGKFVRYDARSTSAGQITR